MAIDPTLSTTLRLSGLSSGMDTESIVTGLMKLEQLKIDKQFQAKTRLEWQRDAYRETNLLVRNFREENMSVLNPDNNMLSESAYKIFDVAMLDSTSAVTISAGSTATSGSLTIDSITQIATSAKVKGISIFNTDLTSMETALKDLDLVTPLTFVDNAISFSINGEEFTLSEDATVAELINTVNANSAAGVRMSYSSLTKGFSFAAKTTGSTSEIDIVNITGNAFSAASSAFGISEGTITGQDAILHIEGIEVVRSNNSFTIDGISYSVKSASATSIAFNVERNVDDALAKIKSFIESYNELVDSFQSKYDEPIYRSYPALTDEQRDSVSDTEAEKWDGFSKSGLLNRNDSISSLLNSMRNAFYTTVSGIGKTPSDIGLRTGSYLDKGKIIINESTLRAAIEANPDEITNLFTATSKSTDYATKNSESGLIARISDSLLQYTEKTTSVSIASAERNINYTQDRMDTLIDRMQQKETALRARFTAMETALALMNSQSSMMQSLFTSNNQ